MFDDFSAYYYSNVVLAYDDYRTVSKSKTMGNSNDLRSALNAATALFHVREHIAKDMRPTRSDTEALCPDYALIGDIVNATKHKLITQTTPHGAPLVANAAQLEEVLIHTIYEDETGTYNATDKDVIVTLSDKSKRKILDVLTNVINFWEHYLHSKKILSSARVFTNTDVIHPRSREECEATSIQYIQTQGVRFRQSCLLQYYNPVSGKAEPINLSKPQIPLSKLNITISTQMNIVPLL